MTALTGKRFKLRHFNNQNVSQAGPISQTTLSQHKLNVSDKEDNGPKLALYLSHNTYCPHAVYAGPVTLTVGLVQNYPD